MNLDWQKLFILILNFQHICSLCFGLSSQQKLSEIGVKTSRIRPTGRRCLKLHKTPVDWRGRQLETHFHPRSEWLTWSPEGHTWRRVLIYFYFFWGGDWLIMVEKKKTEQNHNNCKNRKWQKSSPQCHRVHGEINILQWGSTCCYSLCLVLNSAFIPPTTG